MSHIEDYFERKLKNAKFPYFTREYRFHPVRKWRFDFAWPEYKIALEIEGGVWLTGKRKSRHLTGKGFTQDIIKYNEAACLGWIVIRVTPDQVKDNLALYWLDQIMTRVEEAGNHL